MRLCVTFKSNDSDQSVAIFLHPSYVSVFISEYNMNKFVKHSSRQKKKYKYLCGFISKGGGLQKRKSFGFGYTLSYIYICIYNAWVQIELSWIVHTCIPIHISFVSSIKYNFPCISTSLFHKFRSNYFCGTIHWGITWYLTLFTTEFFKFNFYFIQRFESTDICVMYIYGKQSLF